MSHPQFHGEQRYRRQAESGVRRLFIQRSFEEPSRGEQARPAETESEEVLSAGQANIEAVEV
jgi:hypothetical protein